MEARSGPVSWAGSLATSDAAVSSKTSVSNARNSPLDSSAARRHLMGQRLKAARTGPGKESFFKAE
eukprot:10971847-Alexandrium_andersonii.AAC.1